MGSTFRGGLGEHLSTSVCQGLNCPYCHNAPCLFRHVYVPRPAKRGHSQPPKPVIIVPPFFARKIELPSGGTLPLDVIMVGGYTRSFLQLVLGMIAFGQAGIGPDRHYGRNRFEVVNVKCLESDGYVMKNSKVYASEFASKSLKDVEPLSGKEALLNFRTPFTGPYIPTTVKDIIRLIRHRLILFVNEYGTAETIPSIDEDGTATLREAHRHILNRRSSRSAKIFFYGWTGSISIDLSGLSDDARWILACAPILGMGPDSAFGAGFVDVLRPVKPATEPKHHQP